MIWLKLHPCLHDRETTVEVVDGDTLRVDGEDLYFPPEVVEVPFDHPVFRARRIDGVLHVDLQVFYPQGRQPIDGPWAQGHHAFEQGVVAWLE